MNEELAQRLTRALDERDNTSDERLAYARLAKHYADAGLRGLASYYREQAASCPSR